MSLYSTTWAQETLKEHYGSCKIKNSGAASRELSFIAVVILTLVIQLHFGFPSGNFNSLCQNLYFTSFITC